MSETQALSLVTIVIPAYNAANYIKEAIDSVLAQSYPSIEIIVINDGSTDNTLEIIKGYGSKIKWKARENRGQSATLNEGWDMANGVYIAYLSADDALLPQSVEKAVRILDSNPEVILTYSDFDLMDQNSKYVRTTKAEDFKYHRVLTSLTCPPGPGAFFRKSAYEIVGGWDASFRQIPDLEYWLRLGTQGSFFHLREVLAKYRMHEESQSFKKTNFDRAEEPIRALKKFYESPFSQDYKKYQSKAEAGALFLSSHLHIRANRYGAGFARFFKALVKDPGRLFSYGTWRTLGGSLIGRLFNKLLHGIE